MLNRSTMNALGCGLALLLLSSCASVPPSITVSTKPIEKPTLIVPPVDTLVMQEVKWIIVTEENLDEKLAEVKEKTGQIVFIAITPKGYENLALGIGDLRRYIKQQQSIIAYYEEAVTPAESEPVEEEKE